LRDHAGTVVPDAVLDAGDGLLLSATARYPFLQPNG
jgi:hypothetical protein